MSGVRLVVVDNRIPLLRRELADLARAWPERIAKLHRVHAQDEAPVGTEVYIDPEGHEHPGWLRDSIDELALPGPGHAWLVTVHASYGVYVNNGTRHQAANPFWERALSTTMGELEPVTESMTRAMLARVAARSVAGNVAGSAIA